jgi:hypothetical protein
MKIENTDWVFLKHALSGGPGLDGYIYHGAVYCIPCGQKKMLDVFPAQGCCFHDAQNSALVPVPIFFGEHEEKQNCEDCGEFVYGGNI